MHPEDDDLPAADFRDPRLLARARRQAAEPRPVGRGLAADICLAVLGFTCVVLVCRLFLACLWGLN